MSATYRWSVTALLTALSVLNYADRAVVSAVLPLVKHDLGISEAMLGAISSAFLWSYALASPASGYLADRLPRVRVILWSLGLWSLATVLSGLAADTQQLILARIFLGLSQCAFLPAIVALTAEFQPPARRTLAIVIPLAGANLGFVVGSVTAGYSGDHYGWRPAFHFLGGVGFVLVVVAFFLLRPLATPAVAAVKRPFSPVRDLREILGVKSYLLLLAESCSVAFGNWVLLFWLSYYFTETYKMSLTSSAFAGTLALQLAAMTGYLSGGAFSNRFAGGRRERRMLFQSICYFIAAPFLLAFAFQVDVTTLSLCILAFSLFRGLGSSTDQVIVTEILPTHLRATALGLQNSLNTGVGALGVFLAGLLLKHFKLSQMFACIALPIAVGAALNYLGYKRFLRHDLIE